MRRKKVKVVQHGWARVEVQRTLFFHVPIHWDEKAILATLEAKEFDGSDVDAGLGWERTGRDADYNMPDDVETHYSEDRDDIEIQKAGISFVALPLDEQPFPAYFVEDVRQRVRKDAQQKFLYPTEVIERALNGTLEEFAYETFREKDAEEFLLIMGDDVPKAAAAVKRLWLLTRQFIKDGGVECQILGRKIDPQQHLVELEELEQLAMPSVVD